MHSGNYVLVLHTHLPWVLHHGKWPHGEDWLTEAVAECYIPLLNSFNELVEEGIYPKVSLDISPVLCEQLEHPEFKDIFINYCDLKIKAAKQDELDFQKSGYDPHFQYLPRFWYEWYEKAKNDFINKYDCSIIKGLKNLQDINAIEIMTCGATHGYFPLLGTENSINLQLTAAVENYKKHFGREPKGIWLPECAYRPTYNWKAYIPVEPYHHPKLRPGIEQLLAKHNIKYFITDQDLTERAYGIGYYTNHLKDGFIPKTSPDFDKNNQFHNDPLNIFHVSSSEKVEFGTAIAFTRHRDIAMQVWSGEVGYPGEPDYLDFHKKHYPSMMRYWRVTDSKADMMYKSAYHPDWINDKIDHQANHFIHHIENTLNHNFSNTGRLATLCTPFDTELFGHWWFEGPKFLKAVIKGLHSSPYVNSVTATEQIDSFMPVEVMGLPEGSWGENNNHDVWVNEENKWTWVAIYNDENRFRLLLNELDINKTPLVYRIALQALKEMMLMQSSDWQFLIHTKSAKDYAEHRFSSHHTDFNNLCEMAYIAHNIGKITEQQQSYLDECEKRNSIFPELKIEWWKE